MIPTMLILAGPAGVGKSTTAKAIVEVLRARERPAVQLSFADPLYEMASLILGVPSAILRRQDVKNRPLTVEDLPHPWAVGQVPRRVLQELGEKVRQLSGGDAWAQIAAGRARGLAPHLAVLDDGRHSNELSLGFVVEMRRDGIPYAADHPSAMPPPPDLVGAVVDTSGLSPHSAALAIIQAYAARVGE